MDGKTLHLLHHGNVTLAERGGAVSVSQAVASNGPQVLWDSWPGWQVQPGAGEGDTEITGGAAGGTMHTKGLCI